MKIRMENLSVLNAGKIPTHLWRTYSVRTGLEDASGVRGLEIPAEFALKANDSSI
jgi:hypothetical protein